MESGAGKIHHEPYLRARPDQTHHVSITLRAEILPEVAACPGSGEQEDLACPERDEALLHRLEHNLMQVGCVMEALGGAGDGGAGLWYEVPHHLTSGEPVPIGVAFTATVTLEQIDRVSSHPFVKSIEPVPGEAVNLGVVPPPPPDACPTEVEDDPSKARDAESIRDRGRQPVVIEMKDVGLLPAQATCAGQAECEETWHSFWTRTILNRRHHTCVLHALDSVLVEAPFPVSHFSATGAVAPILPPFGDPPRVTKSFGIGLTWDEVALLAAHPYVERIWTFGDLTPAPGAPDGCPPDLASPIPTLECPAEAEPAAGKFSDEDAAKWSVDEGPHKVGVAVKNGAQICPLPACPSRPNPCTEADQMRSRWMDENREAQRCVREFIASIGGSASEEVFWLISDFFATLTWPQIQSVAGHPHVIHISSAEGGSPPPSSPP